MLNTIAEKNSSLKAKFLDFELKTMVPVVKSFIVDLQRGKSSTTPLMLEGLTVCAGMDQGDWCTAWTKAYLVAMSSESNSFTLDALQLALPPGHQQLLLNTRMQVKQETAAAAAGVGELLNRNTLLWWLLWLHGGCSACFFSCILSRC